MIPSPLSSEHFRMDIFCHWIRGLVAKLDLALFLSIQHPNAPYCSALHLKDKDFQMFQTKTSKCFFTSRLHTGMKHIRGDLYTQVCICVFAPHNSVHYQISWEGVYRFNEEAYPCDCLWSLLLRSLFQYVHIAKGLCAEPNAVSRNNLLRRQKEEKVCRPPMLLGTHLFTLKVLFKSI